MKLNSRGPAALFRGLELGSENGGHMLMHYLVTSTHPLVDLDLRVGL